ncbi:unnamed protein product (macronuclear) [Paramecium tetraurelia]|uniref:Response regulatory domain-containing protein n=1 Tax=Paramecium tetraurelia TaxID=5888 RepID=A0BS33_PARTE|nr:uncharacterized protein GSPATT00031581001 [Paramecium tetraurelia]CAK61350.1 unnamed protein product [Paramecium tetraurelia]|eukprot:XP_001428748.1 hypothetical protein (macronuclear) [Paramecium tetraurelia strain d4-2]
MDNSFLMSMALLVSGILIAIQVIVFNSEINRLQLIITIGQIIASVILLIKPYQRRKLIYLISFMNAQQILQQTNFTFLFIVLTQILSCELEFEIQLNKAFRILLLISQVFRVIFFWENHFFENTQIIISAIFSAILWLKSYLQSHKKKKCIVQNSHNSNNHLQFNSPTNLIVSLKQLDSELAILDNLPIGMIVLDMQQNIKYLNSFAKQYFKNFECERNEDIVILLKQQLIKMLLDHMGGPEDLNIPTDNQISNRPFLSSIQIDDPISTILNQKEEQFNLIFKFKELSKNGISKIKFIKISLIQQFLKSEEITLVMIQNVSSKERKKELTQFIKFQNSILNSFSHELKTPLNSSLQLLEAVSKKLSHSMNQEFIQPALNSNKLLLFQINDILDYAAMQSNQFVHKYQQFNIKEVAEYIKQLFTQACESKGINLTCKIHLTNLIVTNDKQRIIQVLINLLNNSIKFSPSNTHIRIQFKNKFKSSKQYIKIKVKDQGFGISEQKLSFIFRELHSVSSEESVYWMTQNQLSSGIGLKISNRLIQGLAFNEHKKSSFSIKSALQKYTQISFYISDMIILKEDNESISNAQSDDAHCISMYKSVDYKLIQNIHLKSCNCSAILLVDDVPFNIQALKTILMQQKITTDSAYNGIEAIDLVINKYQQKKCHPFYQLIVMDIEMPLLNGLQATQKIISFFNSINVKPPVIIASSAYDSTEEDLSIFSDTLPKPIDQWRLKFILNKYLTNFF